MSTPERADAAFRIMTNHLARRLVKSKGKNHTSHEFFHSTAKKVVRIPEHAKKTLNMRHNDDQISFRRYFKMYTYKDSDVKGLRTILSRKAVDVNMLVDGETLLIHVSMIAGPQTTQIMKILLEFGANPNIVTRIGGTALFLASRHEIEKMELLLLAGAKPNLSKTSPLWNALSYTSQNKLMKLKVLLKYGANPNARNYGGDTVLMDVVSRELDISFLKLILQYRFDVNARSYNGTALGIAYRNAKMFQDKKEYRREVLRLLLQHGADPKIPIPYIIKQNIQKQVDEIYKLAGLKRKV